MRKYSTYANSFDYFHVSSLNETRRIWLANCKLATPRLPFYLKRFENPRVTVNYSNLPHFQDYLAAGNEHATLHATFIAQ